MGSTCKALGLRWAGQGARVSGILWEPAKISCNCIQVPRRSASEVPPATGQAQESLKLLGPQLQDSCLSSGRDFQKSWDGILPTSDPGSRPSRLGHDIQPADKLDLFWPARAAQLPSDLGIAVKFGLQSVFSMLPAIRTDSAKPIELVNR